jgi:hypothetical protein
MENISWEYDKKSELKFFYEIKDGKERLTKYWSCRCSFEMFNVHDLFSVYIDAFQKE